MGWKGTLRSVNAAIRAAERESERNHKQLMKEMEIAEAGDAVESWQDYIHDIVSIHANPADNIDWNLTAKSPEPNAPEPSNSFTIDAETRLEKFQPRFWDFLSGGSEKKRHKLEQGLAKALENDRLDFEQRSSKHKQELIDWKNDVALAKRLLAGELSAKKEVIEELQSLASDDLIGSKVSFQLVDDFVHAVPAVHTDEVVPNYRRKQLVSGRLSETKMPKGEFNELYQDYVCSVALRIAGDLFGLLPDNEVFVTCTSVMLDTKTGHHELTPILSVHFVRETFRRLNLFGIDPSDSLSNFNHEMNFKRTKGFSPITPLRSIDV